MVGIYLLNRGRRYMPLSEISQIIPVIFQRNKKSGSNIFISAKQDVIILAFLIARWTLQESLSTLFWNMLWKMEFHCLKKQLTERMISDDTYTSALRTRNALFAVRTEKSITKMPLEWEITEILLMIPDIKKYVCAVSTIRKRISLE